MLARRRKHTNTLSTRRFPKLDTSVYHTGEPPRKKKKEVFSKMNAEKLKKDIERAAEMAESIHDDMVEKFTRDNIPSEIMIQALNITNELSILVWNLKNISEGVEA